MKKDKYRAAVIGAGRIGATFDTPESNEVHTHAHGYTLNNAIDFIGFYDSDVQKSKNAANVWSGESFMSLDALFKKGRPDIISVCTPDENHAATLERVLEYKPKLIICEKPVTASARETERILKIAHKEEIPILVNYSRRFDPSVQEFKKTLRKGEYGAVLSVTCTYMKGALHIGSHLVNLARYFFGEVKEVIPLFAREDFTPTDKSIAAFLSFERCPQFHFVVGDSRFYSIIELDILMEKKRIRFVEIGHKKLMYEIENDPRYAGFKRLREAGEELTGLRRAASYMIDNAVAHLDSNEPLLCDIGDALETQQVCEKLLGK